MAKLQSITFPDDIRQGIEDYSKSKDISFSSATVELANAGLIFFKKFGTINVDLVAEKMIRKDQTNRAMHKERVAEISQWLGLKKAKKYDQEFRDDPDQGWLDIDIDFDLAAAKGEIKK